MSGQLPKEIKEVHVWTNGDPAVGIPGNSAVIQCAGDFMIDLDSLDDDDRAPMLAEFKQKLSDAFAFAWEEPVSIMFDFEIEPTETRAVPAFNAEP